MSDSHGCPPEDEPKTPMWLPALGAALFVAVALWWAVTPSAAPIGPDTVPSASASVAAAPPLPAQNAPTPPVAQPVQVARPAGSGMAVDPRVEDRLKKLREQMELKPAGAGHR